MVAMIQIIALLLEDEKSLFLYSFEPVRIPTLYLTDTQFLLFHTGG